MYLSVITSAATTVPTSVLSVLAVLSFFGLVPHGKAERLISVLRDPESKRIRSILQLFIAPIVFDVQLVVGVSVAMRLHLGNGILYVPSSVTF